jgi:hypothetical protein
MRMKATVNMTLDPLVAEEAKKQFPNLSNEVNGLLRSRLSAIQLQDINEAFEQLKDIREWADNMEAKLLKLLKAQTSREDALLFQLKGIPEVDGLVPADLANDELLNSLVELLRAKNYRLGTNDIKEYHRIKAARLAEEKIAKDAERDAKKAEAAPN